MTVPVGNELDVEVGVKVFGMTRRRSHFAFAVSEKEAESPEYCRYAWDWYSRDGTHVVLKHYSTSNETAVELLTAATKKGVSVKAEYENKKWWVVFTHKKNQIQGWGEGATFPEAVARALVRYAEEVDKVRNVFLEG